MSNLLNNRINVTVTPAQLTAVKEAFQIIQTNLPFLTGLTPEERKILTSIDSSNRAFTEEAISAGLNNAPFVPTYVSMTDIQTDMMLFTQLDEISIIAQQLFERIEDTKMLAGSEAYQSALTLYKAIGAAADAGAPGADSIMNQLKKRYVGRNSTSRNTTVPPSN